MFPVFLAYQNDKTEEVIFEKPFLKEKIAGGT